MTLLASPGRMPTARKLARAAVAAAGIGVLTSACSGPAAHPRADSRPGASRLSARPSAQAAASTTPAIPAGPSSPGGRPTAPAPSSASASSSDPAGAPAPSTTAPVPCPTAALRTSVGSAGGAAGSLYYPLDFTNISGIPCSLYGFPGASFVSAPGGSQIGGPAMRNPTFGPSLVTLAPGQVAHASVQVVVAQNYPPSVCKPVTAHWLRVYPPGQYSPLYAGLTAVTCTGSVPGGSTLGIYVVRPGANGP